MDSRLDFRSQIEKDAMWYWWPAQMSSFTPGRYEQAWPAAACVRVIIGPSGHSMSERERERKFNLSIQPALASERHLGTSSRSRGTAISLPGNIEIQRRGISFESHSDHAIGHDYRNSCRCRRRFNNFTDQIWREVSEVHEDRNGVSRLFSGL